MQARLIAYPPDAAAVSRWLKPDQRLRIGRDPGCDLVIEHASVSRNHAELYREGERWRLRDLGSKNGSFVDGIAVTDHPLPDHCWLRLGDSYCDFTEFDAVQADALRGRQDERRALSQAMALKVSQQPESDSLPAHVLRGVVELSGCSRGFVLLADPKLGDFTVRASLHLDPDVLHGQAFSGSVGAVQQVLANGKPLVINDIGSEAWLAGRDSVIASGLKTLVCLPLFDGPKVFGAVYADRRGPGEPITDFDLELLGAFTESTTLYLLARRALQSLDNAPRWQTIVEHAKADKPAPTWSADTAP
ncbi:FHA domain-containing protein [Lysobacter tyrosinilyticus]